MNILIDGIFLGFSIQNLVGSPVHFSKATADREKSSTSQQNVSSVTKLPVSAKHSSVTQSAGLLNLSNEEPLDLSVKCPNLIASTPKNVS